MVTIETLKPKYRHFEEMEAIILITTIDENFIQMKTFRFSEGYWLFFIITIFVPADPRTTNGTVLR